MIENNDLRRVYKLPEDYHPEDLLEAFDAHYEVSTREDLALEVVFEDRDPARAAAISNDCVALLDTIFRDITSFSARNQRIYIGRRLRTVEDSLRILQDSLRAFQERTGAISLPDQVVALVKASAEIKARQIESDLQLDVLRGSLGEGHPMVEQLKRSSARLSSDYDDMLAGREGGLFLAMQDLPALGRQYSEHLRRAEIQRRLLEFIYPQYESALIQEQRETANIRVLDLAVAPTKKSRPPRRMIVLAALALTFVATLSIIIAREYMQRLPQRDPGAWEKLGRISGMLRLRRKG